MYAGEVTKSRLLYIQNVSTGLKCLVNSGAQISLFPATNSDRLMGSDKSTLQAVNKSVIKTYGQKWVTLDLGLKREFVWFFVIADIDKPILGVDFIDHYDLLIDVKRRSLRDLLTNLSSTRVIHNIVALFPTVANDSRDSRFTELIKNFQDIVKPNFQKECHMFKMWMNSISRGSAKSKTSGVGSIIIQHNLYKQRRHEKFDKNKNTKNKIFYILYQLENGEEMII